MRLSTASSLATRPSRSTPTSVSSSSPSKVIDTRSKCTTIDFVDEARELARDAGLRFDRLVFRDDLGLSADFVLVFDGARCIAGAKFNRGLKSFTTNEAAALSLLDECGIECVPGFLGRSSRAVLISWLPDDGKLDWRSAGTLLAKIHDIDAASSGLKYSTDPLPLGERLIASARRASARIANSDLLRLADSAIEELERVASSVENQNRFIHRDVRPANWLGNRGASLVDFEHAACGNPAWDFVKLRWWTTERARDEMVEGYRDHREVPNEDEIRLFSLYEATSMLGFFEGRNREYVDTARKYLDDSLR